MASDLIERLTKCALGSADEDVMVRWDKIRAILKQDKGGTWPRECFESIIDGYAEDCEDAVKEIASLRTALAIERERAEKAENEVERLREGVTIAARETLKAIGQRNKECSRAEAAEASLAEAKRLLKPFADARGYFDGHVKDEDLVYVALRNIRASHVRAAARFLAQEEAEEPQR